MPRLKVLSACGRFKVTTPRAAIRSSRISSRADIARLSAEQPARDDDAHDLVGAFEDLMHPHVAEVALDRELLQIPVAAMELQRGVADLEAHVGREALRHR